MVYVIDGDDALSEAERRAAWAEVKVADADAADDAANDDARVAAARIAENARRAEWAAALLRPQPQTQVRLRSVAARPSPAHDVAAAPDSSSKYARGLSHWSPATESHNRESPPESPKGPAVAESPPCERSNWTTYADI